MLTISILHSAFVLFYFFLLPAPPQYNPKAVVNATKIKINISFITYLTVSLVTKLIISNSIIYVNRF